MNILKITTNYPEYFNYLKKNNYNLDNYNYENHLKYFMNDHFGWSDALSFYLEKNHNYISNEIIFNYHKLQTKWLKEYLNTKDHNYNAAEILEKQIEFYKPDIVFAHSYNVINLVHECNKKIRKKFIIIGYDGIGLNNIKIFKNCDAIISCLRSSSNYYKKFTKSLYLPHGFDNRILEKLDIQSLKKGVVFSGGVNNLLHKKRVSFLYELNKKIKINNYLGIANDYKSLYFNIKKYLELKNNVTLLDFIKYLNYKKKLSKVDLGSLYGIKMLNILQNHLISLNNHIDTSNELANMRVFETTGVGTLLLTDKKNNISEFFEDEKEIITYEDINDAIEKLQFLEKNEKNIQKIAYAGYKKTINEHSLEIRVKDLNHFIQKNL